MSSSQENNHSYLRENLADVVAVTLTFKGAIHQFAWHRQIPLLDAILGAGIEVPYSCCAGNCGTCVCRLEAGKIRLRRNLVLSAAHIQQGLILACVAAPVSDSITITYDAL